MGEMTGKNREDEEMYKILKKFGMWKQNTMENRDI